MVGSIRFFSLATLASLIAAAASGQTSGGPIVFPQTTDTNISNCTAFTVLPGFSGGRVFLQHGQFINRGGQIMYGSAAIDSCGDQSIAFAPIATDVTFVLTNLLPFEVEYAVQSGLTPSTTYVLGASANTAVHLQGEIGGFFVRAVTTPFGVVGFAISSLAITQPPANNNVVVFDPLRSPDDSKILISKAASDIGFPSSLQLPPDSSGNPRVKISGTLRDLF